LSQTTLLKSQRCRRSEPTWAPCLSIFYSLLFFDFQILSSYVYGANKYGWCVFCLNAGRRGKMAVPLLTKKIVKKRVKKFKRPQSDRKISVKVWFTFVKFVSLQRWDSVRKMMILVVAPVLLAFWGAGWWLTFLVWFLQLIIIVSCLIIFFFKKKIGFFSLVMKSPFDTQSHLLPSLVAVWRASDRLSGPF